MFFDRLSRKIKHQLFATKRESPEVRVEEVLERDIYDVYLSHIGEIKNCRGRRIHCVNNIQDESLSALLGAKWFERILNKNGDFSYIITGTIQFWLHQKPPIKEYLSVGKQLVENEIENDLMLIFTFVRGDGVRSEHATDI